MSANIRDYMAERITAFELDDALDRLARGSQDRTLNFVRTLMWFHYDDLKNHKVHATKQEWDYFNRFLLLLESEAEADFVRVRSSWRAEWRYFFQRKEPAAADIAVTPFHSISSLLAVRRSVKQFVRTRYPKQIAGRRVRNNFVESIMWIPGSLVMLIISPIFLLIQLLRRSHLEPRVKLPQQ